MKSAKDLDIWKE